MNTDRYGKPCAANHATLAPGTRVQFTNHSGVHYGTVERISRSGSVLIRHRTESSEWLDYIRPEYVKPVADQD